MTSKLTALQEIVDNNGICNPIDCHNCPFMSRSCGTVTCEVFCAGNSIVLHELHKQTRVIDLVTDRKLIGAKRMLLNFTFDKEVLGVES